jgi:hypothetical protein
MKDWTPIFGICAAAMLALSGCATSNNSGKAPGAQSETKSERQRGEFYQTETLTPGIGSALFPDPAWR